MLGSNEPPAHRTVYLMFEVSKEGAGGYIKATTSVVPGALRKHQHTQIDYFYLQGSVCPVDWWASCMMCIQFLLAPAFMGESFHLCLSLLKLLFRGCPLRLTVRTIRSPAPLHSVIRLKRSRSNSSTGLVLNPLDCMYLKCCWYTILRPFTLLAQGL